MGKMYGKYSFIREDGSGALMYRVPKNILTETYL